MDTNDKDKTRGEAVEDSVSCVVISEDDLKEAMLRANPNFEEVDDEIRQLEQLQRLSANSQQLFD
jgi:hypothetical protein